jgi:hypothetical protein
MSDSDEMPTLEPVVLLPVEVRIISSPLLRIFTLPTIYNQDPWDNGERRCQENFKMFDSALLERRHDTLVRSSQEYGNVTVAVVIDYITERDMDGWMDAVVRHLSRNRGVTLLFLYKRPSCLNGQWSYFL